MDSVSDVPGVGTSTGGPLAPYHALLRNGRLKADAAQDAAVERLQSLHGDLLAYAERKARGGWRGLFGRGSKAMPAPKGLYLWGGVGRGKSMVMDLFYASTPIAAKRRVHFHAFMLEVHNRIHRYRQTAEGDPIGPLAADMAGEATLLCFDEFFVTDIADAMILGRLFAGLFDHGVVVVATSNRPPDDLYKDGLQRERFLPFIELLKERMDVLHLDGGRDFRLARLAGRQVYHTPLDDRAAAALADTFADLTDGEEGKVATLNVGTRKVLVPRQAAGVAWFTFEDLCAKPLGAADYLVIAEAYHTVIIEGIPLLSPERRNEAKRFNTLIDTFYEARINLVVSAAAPPQALYTEGDGAFEFERTVSRLTEMQSKQWIEAKRAA
jgi:cell division protein ZapE